MVEYSLHHEECTSNVCYSKCLVPFIETVRHLVELQDKERELLKKLVWGLTHKHLGSVKVADLSEIRDVVLWKAGLGPMPASERRKQMRA